MLPQESNVTCYGGALSVTNSFGFCNVTNQGFLPLLGMNHIDRLPELTLSYDNSLNILDFQLWIDRKESFYCRLEECSSAQGTNATGSQVTAYLCNKFRCECNPGQMLCDPHAMDLSDFFKDEAQGPKGPGKFVCSKGSSYHSCDFTEDAMNNFLQLVIGEQNIKLSCEFGECLPTAKVPQNAPPTEYGRPSIVIESIFAVGLALLILLSALVCKFALHKRRQRQARETQRWYEANGISPGVMESPEGSDSAWTTDRDLRARVMMAGHVPVTLTFENLTYSIAPFKTRTTSFWRRRANDERTPLLNEQRPLVILDSIVGQAEPGQVMAIMGGSGAGKTTFLELLAQKKKSGTVEGSVCINGKTVSPRVYRKLVGYVDQDDHLLPTLTVYETILYSALLRLPRNMPMKAKKSRVQEAMMELGISEIASRKIGWEGSRGISGGEKRRVSIACELVGNPSVLFLDEPTSGLDSFNAFNVIESLVKLARNYKRTIVLTIHQPRSNIYKLFDSLILLSKGQLVYSGPAQEQAFKHFANLGYACPPGFNIADYLVDLTMGAVHGDISSKLAQQFQGSEVQKQVLAFVEQAKVLALQKEAERMSTRAGETGSGEVDQVAATTSGALEHPRKLLRKLSSQIESLVHLSWFGDNGRSVLEDTNSCDYSVTWTTQFVILAQRTMKNVSRNPALLQAHLLVSFVTAIVCGLLFWQVGNDIAGFQNRLGYFFFTCCLFVFECLSSVQSFSSERILFCRERAKGCYSPISYYLTKLLFDLVPMRIIPPIVFGLLSYYMVGLRSDSVVYLFKMLWMLVGLNLVAASVCLLIGIVFANAGVANMVASLVMLFEMLFGGLLLNSNSIPLGMRWLTLVSFFNYALEGLLINEVAGLKLLEHKIGINVEVPGELILDTFGFAHQDSTYYKDMLLINLVFASSLVLGYIYLSVFVKEKR